MMQSLLKHSYCCITAVFSVFGLFGQFEGKITYKVTYISDDPEMRTFMPLLPAESTLWVKDNKSRFEQRLTGGGRQLYITDYDTDASILVMTYFGQEFMVNLTRDDIATLERNSSYRITPGTEVAKVLGYKCSTAYAVNGKDTLKIIYNQELSTLPLLPQYQNLKGIPFEYELVHNGMRIHYQAVEVKEEKLNSYLFAIPQQMRVLSFEEFAKAFAVKL